MCLASIRFVYIKSIFILKKLYFSLIPVFRNFINHFRYHFLIYYFNHNCSARFNVKTLISLYSYVRLPRGIFEIKDIFY